MRHLSIHESAANTQHTHNYCILYATHVQHVRVSGRPGVLSEQLCACSTTALHTSKKKKKGNKEKNKTTHGCVHYDSYLPFDYASAILSPALSHPVQ